MVGCLRVKGCRSVDIDRPMITAEAQPVVVTTIPSHWGGRLRRARVLNVWMPMTTMKKNDAYCPICPNDPKQGKAQKPVSERVKTVHDTLSDARCPYETSQVTINTPRSRQFFSPALTPPPLIQSTFINPLTALIQLLSSKDVAYWPS